MNEMIKLDNAAKQELSLIAQELGIDAIVLEERLEMASTATSGASCSNGVCHNF